MKKLWFLSLLPLGAALMFPLSSSRAATIPGLFPTGVNAAGSVLAPGSGDPHYLVTAAAQGSVNAPAIVMANHPNWLANDANSSWIGVVSSGSANVAVGEYHFRTTFDLTGLEPSTAQISFRVSVDNDLTGVVLNGVSQGISFSGFGGFSGFFTVDSGFVEGVNTLDFLTGNGGTDVNPAGLRVEISGTADFEAPPGTPPSIVTEPTPATVAVGEGASFSVEIYGSKPLQYQWRANGAPVPDATNAIFLLPSVAFSDAGLYDVVVSNAFGSTNSAPVALDVVFLSPEQLSYESIGPSSRRTGLIFSEIMFHPKDRADGRELEFIEIYNTNPYDEELSGYRLSGEVEYVFPEGTFMPGKSFVVVAAAPADVEAVYGITDVFGPWSSNKLANSFAQVRLRKRSGAIVLDMEYSDQPPWPEAADGTGHSLVLARPSYGENNPRAWEASAVMGGSPGAHDPLPTGPLEHVVINEILAHTDFPALDYVELYNASPLTVSLSGAFLSDDADTNKFRIPDGTVLGPNEYVSFDESELGFALGAEGETVYLVNPDETRVVDALRFDGQANAVAYGRHPDGGPRFQFLTSQTPGQPNAVPVIGEVVINEIMYNPISGDDGDEFVELFNRGAASADVGGWRFTDGIDYTIPDGTSIAAGGYLVVAAEAARLLTNHPGLAGGAVVGDFGGQLANGGERLALARPDTLVETNQSGTVITNRFYIVMDEVSYRDGGRWGRWSDGGGSSLELIDPRSDNGLAANWADSDETAKSSWTTIEMTDILSPNHPAAGTINQLHFFLLDAGEALIDDVEVIFNGANRVTNPGFESGLSDWFFQGTQRPSFLETGEGFSGSQSLHLVATARGGVANRVRTGLSAALTAGSTVTLRAKARWLRGHRELVFRTIGSGVEATGAMPVPANLGTPGAANSRRVANAGPAIHDVAHLPALPRAGEDIRVTARVWDPDGVANVTVRYRIDPSSALTSAAMNDGGTGGDLVAGDGLYTATIPGRNAGTLIAFRVEATDGFGPAATALFPADAPTRECLVRVGESEVPGDFASYRFWLTQAAFDFWDDRETSSNEDVDTTFVYGNERVFYNVGVHYGASDNYVASQDSPTGRAVGYNLEFPTDDRLMGAQGVRLDWPIQDGTILREHLMYWILEQLRLPNNYRRYIYLFINGQRRSLIYEDTQRPNGDMLEEWYPNDAEGELFKTDGWFEANEAGVFNSGTWLRPFLEFIPDINGDYKLGFYRFKFKPRSTDATANAYTNVFAMIDAANIDGPAYESALADVIDMENWMFTFAMNDLASFWDSFGNPNSKNAYIYNPQRSGWKIMSWDFDVGLGGRFNDDFDIPLFGGGVDPAIVRMYNTPAFVRHYWRAMDEAMNTFFNGTAVTPFLTTRYQAFQANNLSTTSPFVPSGTDSLSIPNWIDARRNFILPQMSPYLATFSVDGPDSVTVTNNLFTISGTAPVRVHTITVNGLPYPITWTTVNAWTLQVPLLEGANSLTVEAWDRFGSSIPGASRTLSVEWDAAAPQEDFLIINEIMYHPEPGNAEFIEIHNLSPDFSFDLSGWEVNGIDYTFPPGSIITNGQYLILAKNRTAFVRLFGAEIAVYDEFDGSLDNGGETLTLLRPAGVPGEFLVVDRVTYDDGAPWPGGADGIGTSLQLIDPEQDNARVSNWAAGSDWKRVVNTRNIFLSSSRLTFSFDVAGGDVYLDDVELVSGDVPGAGPNILSNPGFESGLASWFTNSPMARAVVTSDVAHSGGSSLHLETDAGTTLANLFQNFPSLTASTNYTLSYWYLPGSQGGNLRARLNQFFDVSVNVDRLLATPGAANASRATLPPYPPVWINEVQPQNLTGPIDAAGDRDPWIELYNAGSEAVSLDGYYLANQFDNVTQWAFPAGAALQPGQFRLVWADGEPGETTPNEWHAGFTLTAGTGVVVLSRLAESSPQIVDYVPYEGVPADRSYGSYPDGSPFFRQSFFFGTPLEANDVSLPPVALYINEWMASNDSAVSDPSDFDFDDWFEIYNPNGEAADLTGYFLSDDPDDPMKFEIPPGFVIAPEGYMLVWADEEQEQSVTSGELHVNFRLGAEGESISLHAPNGQLVDQVVFGAQTDNVSEGRFPDGAPAPFVAMTTFTPRMPNQGPVAAAPEIMGIIVEAGTGQVTLMWTSHAGAQYRVQYKNAFSDPDWTDFPTVTAAGSTVTWSGDNLAAAGSQRIYRVVRLGNP